MPTTSSIARHVPLLRRYARVLSGNQAAGDAYVAATLETLLEDPSSLDADAAPRIALYALFTRLWNAVPFNTMVAANNGARQVADDRIAQLAARPRQAFVLHALEGFSEEEAAQILGISAQEFSQLLDDAGRQLSEQMATDVLIIEDEPLIAMDLEYIVEQAGHRVIGVARTRDEAVSLCHAHRPGLVLADVQLADGSSGLDAVTDIVQFCEMPVIFITAYPEKLLTGERPEPTFLIAKPFQPSHVAAVMGQALFFEQNATAANMQVSA